MKKLLLIVFLALIFNLNAFSQLTMTAFWVPGPTNVAPTYFYISTNNIWSVTNRNDFRVLIPYGITNYTSAVTTNRLFSMYVTTYYTNTTAESRPSNQVRYQLFPIVRGKANYSLVALDYTGTNWFNFQIVISPTNGIISGVLPNLTYTPTNNVYFFKDRFVYKSPELFANTNILYYYSLHFINTNSPVSIQDAVGL